MILYTKNYKISSFSLSYFLNQGLIAFLKHGVQSLFGAPVDSVLPHAGSSTGKVENVKLRTHHDK